MADRKKALEEKKRRLEELKARRAQRGTQTASATEQAKSRIQAASNLDDYIDGLLQVPAGNANNATANADNVNVNGNGNANGDTSTSVPTQAPVSRNSSTDGKGNIDNVNDPQNANVGQPATGTTTPASTIRVVKAETFEMGTQVEDEDFPPPSVNGDDDQLPADPSQGKTGSHEQLLSSGEIADSALDQQQQQQEKDQQSQQKHQQQAQEEAKILSAEEVEKELASDTFSSFLNTASKKVERVLGSAVLADLLTDYDGGADGVDRSAKVSDGSKFISSRQIFECPKWTATRDVTDMDWSPLHRELMLCSYHMPSSAAKLGESKGSTAVKALSPEDTPSDSLEPRRLELQSDGLALVWNLAMPNRPEHVFTCGSPVTATRFHPTESSLIVGGCQSGQVVVWDVRAGRMPVQKSSLTTNSSGNSKGHTHPICAMEIIEAGGGLVTGATDGRVNFWSFANLRDPAESLQLGDSVSCLAVAPESETLVCGDEMGNIYTIQSNQSTLGGGGQRSKRKVAQIESGKDEGHFGMVSSISTRSLKVSPRAGLTKGFLRGSGGLFLSAGVDWTVKLWGPAYTEKPLLSLLSHSYDYMSDVQWSPAHPSLMATASSNGTLGLWNLAQTLEEPITGSDGIVVEPDGGSGRGLNKIKWSSDGRRMLVASADRVHVLVMAEGAVRKKGDEEARMMNHITSRGLLN